MTQRNRIVRAPRKERMWGIVDANGSLIAATAAAMIFVDAMTLLRADVGYDLPGVTASAIRLNIGYRKTTAAIGDDDTVAMGIGWVSDTAIAAGGAALPDPSTDHFDWMAHDIRTVTASTGSDADQMNTEGFYTVKNDSMRKQRENHSTLGLVFRCTLLQSVSIQVFVGGRVLFLLP